MSLAGSPDRAKSPSHRGRVSIYVILLLLIQLVSPSAVISAMFPAPVVCTMGCANTEICCCKRAREVARSHLSKPKAPDERPRVEPLSCPTGCKASSNARVGGGFALESVSRGNAGIAVGPRWHNTGDTSPTDPRTRPGLPRAPPR